MFWNVQFGFVEINKLWWKLTLWLSMILVLQVLKATGLSHSFLAKDNFRPGVWTRRNTKCKNFVMHLTVLPSNPKCFLHLSYVSAASATRDGSFSSPVHCYGTSSGGLCSQSHSLGVSHQEFHCHSGSLFLSANKPFWVCSICCPGISGHDPLCNKDLTESWTQIHSSGSPGLTE